MRPLLVASLVAATALAAVTPLKTQKPKPRPQPLPTEAIDASPSDRGKWTALSVSAPSASSGSGPVGTLPAPGCAPGPPLAGSSVKTFGFYNPSTGTAVKNEVWTFDHGAGGWEGWTRDDLTEDNFTAFQQVDTMKWNAHPNVPPTPLICSDGIVWLGFHEDQADSACWVDGLGYGNNWGQRLMSPRFINSSGGSVDITFNYWYDCEYGYDWVHVYIQKGTTRTLIAQYTGAGSDPVYPLYASLNVAVVDTFRVVIEFTSDAGWSDEDGLYATYWGPFGMSCFNVSGLEGTIGGPPPPYWFNSSLQGWTAAPIPGVGSYAALNDFASYGLAGCGQDRNVVSFHDGNNGHPAGQHERITSPPVDISSYGTASLNLWAEYDIYADLPLADSLFWTWGFQYYPYICPATGDSIWSPPDGTPYLFYSPSVSCRRYRSFANDLGPPGVGGSGTILVPAGADSVRFFLEVSSWSTSESGNVTPLFDNIVIGVSSADNIIHVPSPSYPTIQAGVDNANYDSVVVRPGVYTGASNRDIDFGGLDKVLLSESGPVSTIVDCERLGRGLYFHTSETSNAVVNGFKFVHGTQTGVGSAIYVAGSSPTIRNCMVDLTTVTATEKGVVRIDSGAPTFDCCVIAADTTTVHGGVVIVNGGNPAFNSCTIANNVADFSCVSLAGGAPSFIDCQVSDNVTAHALVTATAAVMSDCIVTNNSGIGMHFYPASASTVTSCTFSGNVDGGIAMETNSSTFSNCVFNANGGPGIDITNVAARASVESQGASPAGVAGTSPYFFRCTIAGNVNTSSSGGGILFNCSNVPISTFAPVYEQCIITGNSSFFSGGGIAVCGQAVATDIAPMFQNCTVSANNSGDRGGGIYIAVDNGGSGYAGMVTMNRTIMWGNCAAGVGDQAFMETDNFLSFDCSNFDPEGVEGTGSVILGSEQAYGDPEFCEASNCNPSGTVAGNFAIAEGSPADPLMSPCGQLIGANPVLCAPTVGVNDPRTPPVQTALWQNVPNPFNPVTSMRMDLAGDGHVTLTVYDVAGHAVRHLIDADLPASSRTVLWDGLDDGGRRVATGVYFARLVASDLVQTRKMVMIK